MANLLKVVGERPTRTLKYIFWVMFVVIGLIILSPWYQTDFTPTLRDGLRSTLAIKGYAVLLVLTGAVGLYQLIRSAPGYNSTMLRRTTFFSFLLLTFFTVLRLATYGPFNIVWCAYLIITLTMGVIHLHLKWEAGSK